MIDESTTSKRHIYLQLPHEFRQTFDAAVIEVKPGALRFATHYSNAVNPPAYDGAKAQRKPLSMRNLEQLQMIMTLGIVSAILILFGEIFVH